MPLCPAFSSFGTALRVALAAAALWAAGCTPALDWRTVRQDASPVAAVLPCKPERAERTVPLRGPQQPAVLLHMLSCKAGGHTFALASVALPRPVAAGGDGLADWIDAWQRASWATLQLTPTPQGLPDGWRQVPCLVRGAAVTRCLRGPARGPGGESLQAELHWASDGQWLAQAALYGPGLSPEAHETFFAGVTLR